MSKSKLVAKGDGPSQHLTGAEAAIVERGDQHQMQTQEQILRMDRELQKVNRLL